VNEAETQGINSIGGIGGDCSSENESPTTISQTADITISPLSSSLEVDGTMQFTVTTKGCQRNAGSLD
jgi:hypothetical protein